MFFLAHLCFADLTENDLQVIGANLAKVSQANSLFGIADYYQFVAFTDSKKVFISRGLLLKLENRDQLAFVIAHEIAHIERDSSKKVRKSGGLLPKVAGVLVGAVLSDNEIGKSSGQALSIPKQMRKSRAEEFACDKRALGIMRASGYDIYATLSVFDIFASVYYDGGHDWLATHPSIASRRELVETEINRLSNMPKPETTFLTNYSIGEVSIISCVSF